MKRALFLTLLLVTTAAFASVRQRLFEMQSMLESRVSAIVRAMDPSAVVIVRLKAAARGEAQLPGTPFIMEDITVQEADGDPLIASVDLQILTDAKLSPTVSKLVTEIAAQVGPVNLKVEKLPPELRSKVADEDSEEDEPAEETPAAPVAPPPPQKIVVQMVEPPKAPSTLPPWAEKLFPFMVIGLGFLLAGAAAVIALMLGRGSKRLAGIVQSGFTDLASVFSYSSSGGGSGAGHEIDKSDLQALAGLTGQAAASGAPSALDELSEEGLLSLITDCYWSELDSYAAYLWRRLPLHRRKSLLAVASFLAEYANYLVAVKEENLAVEHEPCYLAPLPMWHLNNNVVSELIRDQAGLRFHLSSIRMAHLNLSSRERLTVNATTERLVDLPSFETMAPSPKRTLRMRQEIPIHTVEEERELVNLQNLSLDAMESIPTLAWLLKMPADALAQELTRFSARELASAWIGPDEILAEIEKQLPEKKRELLKSYRGQVTPQRSSPTFHALRNASIQFLHSPEALAA